jgi:hypothetical protein
MVLVGMEEEEVEILHLLLPVIMVHHLREAAGEEIIFRMVIMAGLEEAGYL